MHTFFCILIWHFPMFY